jgi:hypothetical protein
MIEGRGLAFLPRNPAPVTRLTAPTKIGRAGAQRAILHRDTSDNLNPPRGVAEIICLIAATSPIFAKSNVEECRSVHVELL